MRFLTISLFQSFTLQGLPAREETCVEMSGFIQEDDKVIQELVFTGAPGTLFYDYIKSLNDQGRVLFRINDDENLCQGWAWGQVSEYLKTDMKVDKKKSFIT